MGYGLGRRRSTALAASRPTAMPTAAKSVAAWTALCRISPPVGGSTGPRADSGGGLAAAGRLGSAAPDFAAPRDVAGAPDFGVPRDFAAAAPDFAAAAPDFAAAAPDFAAAGGRAADAALRADAAGRALAAGAAEASVGAPLAPAGARRALRRAGRLRGSRERTSSPSFDAGIVRAFSRTRAKAESRTSCDTHAD